MPRLRMLRVLIVAVALISVAAVVSFLFARRALEQSRLSRSRELAASSLLQLRTEPLQALRSSLAAARERHTAQAEDALRRALASPLRVDLRGPRPPASHPWRLRGDAGGIAAFDCSPDGRRVVTANDDGTVRIWDAAEGHVLHLLHGHRGFITDARYSPDGRLLATTGGDGTVRLWAADTGNALHVLRGYKNPVLKAVHGAVFSPDGSLLASFGEEVVRVWSTADGRQLASLESPVESAAFDPSGRMLLTAGGSYGTARLWSVADGKQLHVLRDGDDRIVLGVAFSPDGKPVVTCTSGEPRGRVAVWNVATGRRERGRTVPDDFPWSVEYSRDGRVVLIAGDDMEPRLWTLAGGPDRVLRTGGGVMTARFDAESRRVVTAGADARVFDAATGTRLAMLAAGTPGSMHDARFATDGRSIVTAGGDGVTRIWSDGVRVAATESTRLTAIAFSPDGRRLATAASSGDVTVRQVSTGREFARRRFSVTIDEELEKLWPELARVAVRVSRLAFSADGSRLHVSLSDGAAQVWTPSTDQVRTLRKTGDSERVVVSRDGSRLLVVDEKIVVRDVATRHDRTLSRHDGSAQRGDAPVTVAMDPAGKRIVTTGTPDDAFVRIWDAASGRELIKIRASFTRLSDAPFSADGKRLVTVSVDGVARIWDAASGRRLRELRGHTQGVTSATFSADGRFVLTSADDQTIRIWDADSGTQVHQIAAPLDFGAALSPDNQWVAVMRRGSGVALFYPCDACADWDELVARAAKRLGQ